MKQSNTDVDTINELLTRGTLEIIDLESLKARLFSGKILRIKLGIDPTSPNLHLGRSIPLLKLKDFQDLGHTIVFIIGDFTAVIGDTSDKESERPMLSEDEVARNLETYISQASKIIDIERAEIYRNSEWLGDLNYHEIGRQADVFSVNEFISRENIAKRLDSGKRVSMRELLYPLMQGYDSVRIRADVEIGGSDQRFNLLAGRDLQRLYGQPPQDILMNPLIEGLDGSKMSSSAGNTVNLFDEPSDMYGKIMSVRDEFIIRYFTLLTRVPMETVNEYASLLAREENPKHIKMKLAHEIVRMYHGEDASCDAARDWEMKFSKKEIPDDIPEHHIPHGTLLIDALVSNGIIESKSQVRRLLESRAISHIDTGEIVSNPAFAVTAPATLRVGKKIFVRFIV